MINSSLQLDLFHFKVLELSTYEDTEKPTECRVRFHFLHRLIKSKRKNEDSDEQYARQEWNLDNDTAQRLYLSKDTSRMMEVINNTFAIVYTRRNINEEGKAIYNDEYAAKDSGQ